MSSSQSSHSEAKSQHSKTASDMIAKLSQLTHSSNSDALNQKITFFQNLISANDAYTPLIMLAILKDENKLAQCVIDSFQGEVSATRTKIELQLENRMKNIIPPGKSEGNPGIWNHCEKLMNEIHQATTKLSDSKNTETETIQKKFDAIKKIHTSDLLTYGLSCSHQEKHAQAIRIYSAILLINPLNDDALTYRGIEYDKQGQSHLAKIDLDKAIQINPNNANAFNTRGIARVRLNDITGAIKDFDTAIQLDPDNARAYKNRGHANYENGDTAFALEDYTVAIRLNPTLAAELKSDIEDCLKLNSKFNFAEQHSNSLNNIEPGLTQPSVAQTQPALFNKDKAALQAQSAEHSADLENKANAKLTDGTTRKK